MTRNISFVDVIVQVLVAVGIGLLKGEATPDLLARIGFTVPFALICISAWRSYRGA